MNPKPLSWLKNFTVPCIDDFPSKERRVVLSLSVFRFLARSNLEQTPTLHRELELVVLRSGIARARETPDQQPCSRGAQRIGDLGRGPAEMLDEQEVRHRLTRFLAVRDCREQLQDAIGFRHRVVPSVRACGARIPRSRSRPHRSWRAAPSIARGLLTLTPP